MPVWVCPHLTFDDQEFAFCIFLSKSWLWEFPVLSLFAINKTFCVITPSCARLRTLQEVGHHSGWVASWDWARLRTKQVLPWVFAIVLESMLPCTEMIVMLEKGKWSWFLFYTYFFWPSSVLADSTSIDFQDSGNQFSCCLLKSTHFEVHETGLDL